MGVGDAFAKIPDSADTAATTYSNRDAWVKRNLKTLCGVDQMQCDSTLRPQRGQNGAKTCRDRRKLPEIDPSTIEFRPERH